VAPVHVPPQHSVATVQASPFCLQYDVAALHLPPMQPCEQHSESPPQVLPEALQLVGLFVAQTPPEHLPLQHSLPLPHATATFLHALARQVPVAPHDPEQQSELFTHLVAEPVAMHGPLRLPHWFGA
jgi:hypothetical protein